MQALKTAAPDEWPGKRTAQGPAAARPPTAPDADVDLPDNGRG